MYRSVRNFYEAETDIDIMMKMIDNLKEEVENMKSDSTSVDNDINKITDYFERRYNISSTQNTRTPFTE